MTPNLRGYIGKDLSNDGDPFLEKMSSWMCWALATLGWRLVWGLTPLPGRSPICPGQQLWGQSTTICSPSNIICIIHYF